MSVLRRGLSYDPSQRFQSAREFLDALVPDAPAGDRADERQNPFRFLAAFTESDRWRFHGRVLATAQLTDLIVYNPFVVLVGPMGMGRTSLLRAGVTPRLADLRVQGVYVSCVDTPSRQAADAIVPGALDLRSALDTWFASGSGRLVLMLDDLDALLHHDEGERERQTLFSMLHSCHRAYPERFGALIVVEPDNLGMLSALRHTLTEAPPVMRLGPLTTRGCREALVRSFEEFDITLSAEAIDALLRRATRLSRGEQGLFNNAAPHTLQLAGGLVFEALEARPAAALSGGDVEEILAANSLVARWLDGVLERIAAQGHPIESTIALLRAFLGEQRVRAVRNEAELGDMLPDFERSTLEELVAEGLLARISRPGAALAWQLEHQALVDVLEPRGSA